MRQVIALLLLIAGMLVLPAATQPPPQDAPPAVEAELSAALVDRASAEAARSVVFELFDVVLDRAVLAPDGQTAVLWVAAQEPDSGRILAAEPGLAIARLVDGAWQVLLPGDEAYADAKAALPPEMLPVEQQTFAPDEPAPDNAALVARTGYYLPWIAGYQHFLEGSILHFQEVPALGYPSCYEPCRYAYDFTAADHFPLVASRDGYVYSSRDNCHDGDGNCTNYMVLRESAGGGPYQIYLHIAYATIPDRLTPGTAVPRGTYIGDTDDTGYSTSNHVHFMVVNSLFSGTAYPWGNSIDIRFNDVALNGGIPRNCYEVSGRFQIYDGADDCPGPFNPSNPFQKDYFVSGNVGAYPPSGTLVRPAQGATIATNPANGLIDLEARNLADDVDVSRVQFLVKVNNVWQPVGAQVNQPGSTVDNDADLCAVAPLNGQVQFALRIWDHEGNITTTSANTATVDHACPPPTSTGLLASAVSGTTAVRLSWTASAAGAGLSRYEVQWRTAGSAWNAAQVLTAAEPTREVLFTGQPGAYEFRLRAFDANNQPEPWPAGDAPDLAYTIPALTCTGDAFENGDDALAGARPPGSGSLCAAGDADWFVIPAVPGVEYFAVAQPTGGSAMARVEIFTTSNGSVVAMGESPAPGISAYARAAAAINQLWVRVTPGSAWGPSATYLLTVNPTEYQHLPGIQR